MFKRLLITFSTVLVLIPVLLTAPVLSVGLSPAELASVESTKAKSEASNQPEKKENGLARALKAPFKAIGRLFGRGKNDNKLQRLSEKDARKFESSLVNRIDDATSAPSAPAHTDGDPSAKIHLERGRKLLNDGSLNAAIAELATAASLDPKLSEAPTLLGIAYDRKGLAARAQEAFETALHAPDDEAMHLNNLGYLEYKNGEYDKAIKYLKRAAKLAPNDQRIWNNLGLSQAEVGKFDDAYKSFARAAGEFKGHLNVAIRLENLGFPDDAIKHLEKALALRSNSTVVLTRLVTLYERVRRHERAEQARSALTAFTEPSVAEKN